MTFCDLPYQILGTLCHVILVVICVICNPLGFFVIYCLAWLGNGCVNLNITSYPNSPKFM